MSRLQAPLLILLLLTCANLFGQQRPARQNSLFDETQRKDINAHRQMIKSRFELTRHAVNQNGQHLLQKPQKIESGPLDTCATHTYRLRIGDDNTNEVATEITHLASGEMLVTGKTNKNGSQDDALLVKLGGSGNVEWMKTYGNANTQEIFYKARPTADGGIIAIGSSFSTGFTSGYMMICRMDGNGNLQWTKKYQPGPGNYANGADIIQLADNDFAFLGDDGKNIIYGKLSSAGTLLWDQQCLLTDSTRALNIVEDYDGWIIASAGMQAGWHVSNVIKVDTTNGSFIWRKRFGGSNMNERYIFNKMEYVNLKPRITGVCSLAGGPYHFMRLTVNTAGTIEFHEQYDAPSNPDTSSSFVLTPWAEALAYSPNNQSDGVTIFENQPDVSQVLWSNTYSNATVTNVAGIEKSTDAGFIAACTTSGVMGSDILLVKIDSAGLSPGCDGTATSIVRSNTGTNTQDTIFTPAGLSLNEDNTVPGSSLVQLDTAYSCRQITCPARSPEDTCLQSFRKNYRSYEFSNVVTAFSLTNDDHLIVSGVGRDNGYDPYTDAGFIMKTDNRGNIVAELKMLIGLHCDIARQVKLADGNVLVAGTFMEPGNTVGGIFLSKFDNNLNNIWTKTYDVVLPSYNLDDIIESPDGSLFMAIVRYDFTNLADKIVMLKYDNAGNIVSQNAFGLSSGFDLLAGYGSMVCIGSNIYLAEDILNTNGSNWNLFLVNFDAATVQLKWAKTYTYTGGTLDMRWISKTNNGGLLVNGSVQLSSLGHTVIAKLDNGGNIIKQAAYDGLPYAFPMITAANNDVLASGETLDNFGTPAQYVTSCQRLDSNLQVKISKKNTTWSAFTVRGIVEDSQGYIYTTGSNFYPNPYNADLFISKYTPDGLSGSCPSDTLLTQQQPVNLVLADVPMTSSAINAVNPSPTGAFFTNSSLQQNELLCAKQSGCDTLWITGPKAICDTSIVYDFPAHKNAGCNAPVNWIVPAKGITILLKNDSLLRIKFSADSAYTIKAQLLTGCKVYQDSISVSVHNTSILNLGRDTTLCPGNSIVLHVGGGFISYQWQDGSTDSTFKVTVPGTYYIKVNSFCNGILQDTVIIAAGISLPLFIGNDTAICRNDSLALHASPGFVSYLWSPAYNINTITGNNVTVWPSSDMSYNVTATQANGCVVSDTLTIAIYNLQPLTLGNDTSICTGTQLLLDAGSGFAGYQWNTGAITEQIAVSAAGFYNVTVTDIRGCRSKDTIEIKSVFIPAPIHLGNDTSLCSGESLHLDAGNGFNNYLWSTGPITGSIDVNSPGIFWIDATDSNHCHSGDTISVLSILPVMSINLGNDTTICQGEKVPLDAGPGFASYQWNTGETTQEIYASKQGLYFVAAGNSNNCISRDSLIIVNVNALPVVNLDKDSALCVGATRVLDAGQGTGYLWQDASTNRTYIATGIGIYWVTVTNSSGCTNSDTTEIKSVLPLPVDFIIKDTAVCESEALILAPNKELYFGYLWSTGAMSSSIEITSPGQYWLQVTNMNGCTAKEYINVSPKNCITAIYFPNAFTPNNDGLNDTYKPKVYGAILKFHMAIYNRFGQKVFETYDHSKGWDGSFNNNGQDTNTFTWYSEYQLKNEPPKTQKGIVTLIH